MNKNTIMELVNAYKRKTAEALHAEVLKETLADIGDLGDTFVEKMDAVLVAANDVVNAVKDGHPELNVSYGMRSAFGFSMGENVTGRAVFSLGVNQMVRARIYTEDDLSTRARNIDLKFDRAVRDISLARSVKRIKEILVAIGLPEIEVDDPTNIGAVDYEFVRNAITQIKALPAPENGGS